MVMLSAKIYLVLLAKGSEFIHYFYGKMNNDHHLADI